MQNRRYYLLLHPLFISCILLLLLNDLYLKPIFHNWLTGKLSDFTGLYSFAFFLSAFFYKYRKAVIIFCGLFFLWWKTPFSSPAIDTLNDIFSCHLVRTVDYTDLFALSVLPFAYTAGSKPFYPDLRFRQLYLNLSCVVSLFAFCNTSMIRQAMYETQEEIIRFNREFTTPKSEEEIIKLLSQKKENYSMDSVHFYPSRKEHFYYRIQKTKDSSTWVPVTNNEDSTIFIKVKEYAPYYIVHTFRVEGDELTNLEFRFSKGKKKNTVFIISFHCNSHPVPDFYAGKLRRKYIRFFKELFR